MIDDSATTACSKKVIDIQKLILDAEGLPGKLAEVFAWM